MTRLPPLVRMGADTPVVVGFEGFAFNRSQSVQGDGLQDVPGKSNVGPIVMGLSLLVALGMFVHVLTWKR